MVKTSTWQWISSFSGHCASNGPAGSMSINAQSLYAVGIQ